MKLYRLTKVVLSIRNNAEAFLNGIVSNSFESPQNAFLNLHGRIVATFEQIKVNSDEYLIVIEEKFLDKLLEHLDKFIRLSHAIVEKKDDKVYFDLEGNYIPGENEFFIPQKRGQLVVTRKDLETNVSEEEFTVFRLKNNIPVHGVDYVDEMILNVSEEDFVSFTKGCFLGQEFVSKVYHKSKPSWKLVVKAEEECDESEKQKMTSKVLDPATGRTYGFVFVRNL